MSTSLTIENAPEITETWPCGCLNEAGEACPDCHHCKGTGKDVFVLPDPSWTMNMAEGNARRMLELLSITWDYCGTIRKGEPQRALRGRIALLLNNPVRRSHFTVPSSDSRGQGGCRVISAGMSDDYIRDRLRRLDRLLALALENNADIHWG